MTYDFKVVMFCPHLLSSHSPTQLQDQMAHTSSKLVTHSNILSNTWAFRGSAAHSSTLKGCRHLNLQCRMDAFQKQMYSSVVWRLPILNPWTSTVGAGFFSTQSFPPPAFASFNSSPWHTVPRQTNSRCSNVFLDSRLIFVIVCHFPCSRTPSQCV